MAPKRGQKGQKNGPNIGGGGGGGSKLQDRTIFQHNLSLNKGVEGSKKIFIICKYVFSLIFLVSKNWLKPLSPPNSLILVASNL